MIYDNVDAKRFLEACPTRLCARVDQPPQSRYEHRTALAGGLASITKSSGRARLRLWVVRRRHMYAVSSTRTLEATYQRGLTVTTAAVCHAIRAPWIVVSLGADFAVLAAVCLYTCLI